ncbi:hypothetical protein M3M39_04845 [Fructilactobacillus hinvesii]|uniref:Holin n=1 Tax=Fructilactobacillus hinvesii TaxID=2940300 RepID=A0ABY5BT13_9LACO|nr:hypothetical protein [Fructilactobacillus hinvesii]USS87451.1 hypothetical protein M3M39_04845 [Fructilactobacillus hinvesii]
MTIFGLTIEDWASVMGILTVLGGGLTFLVKKLLVEPTNRSTDALRNSNEALSESIDKLGKSLDNYQKHTDATLQAHQLQLQEHAIKIHHLEADVGSEHIDK